MTRLQPFVLCCALIGCACCEISPAADVARPGQEEPSASRSVKQLHWSLRPIERPAVPSVEADRVQSPIDAFVIARLAKQGLALAPPADPRTLLRRTSFNLLGLPPAWEQVQRFEADPSPENFADLVDQMLARHEYGQYWARHWLDVARYADTKGYVFTSDPRYPYAYTYRDYVVDAFNDDVPYDQFVKEQLAADLLEQPRDEKALAALGFLTVGRRFNNNVHDIRDDRIDVITRGFMGLTVACARCHDHKYDPITMADYYSLYGVLQNTNEPSDPPYLGDPEQQPGYDEFAAELHRRQQAAEDLLRFYRAELLIDFRTRAGDYLKLIAERKLGRSEEDTPKEFKRQIIGQWQQFLAEEETSDHPIFSLWKRAEGISQSGFSDEFQKVLRQNHPDRDAEPNAPQRNLLVAAALVNAMPQSLVHIGEAYKELFEWADSPAVLVGNSAVAIAQLPSGVHDAYRDLLAKSKSDASPAIVNQRLFTDLQQVQAFLYSDDAPHIVDRGSVRRNLNVKKSQALDRAYRRINEWEVDSPDAPPRAMVLQDANKAREPHIFIRGDASRPGEQITRHFLSALAAKAPEPLTSGSGRLQLAEAIASRDNPLTARVIVNRVWQNHFGQGLVHTPSNFGILGDKPTHPQLLDWLAAEFIEHGWSLKRLQREITRSAVYQQQSGKREGAYAQDPENRLLWRMNRRRLQFEQLRDSLLFYAGRLDATCGGRPFQLGETPSNPRRTIYGMVDRQHLYDPLRNFDVASPDASTATRPRTSVPQQSLFLLNSPFIAEQAKHLAERVFPQEAGPEKQPINRLFEIVLQRSPTDEEQVRFAAFLEGEHDAESGQTNKSGEGGALSPLGQLAQVLLISNEAAFID